MPRAKVLVTREIPKPGIDIVKKMCEVKVNQLGRSLTKDEPIGEVKDIDGLLPLLTNIVDGEIMDAVPKLIEAKTDTFFYNYMVRIKKRFNALYELEDAGEINSQIGQIKRELKFFYTRERREWASPCLDFIQRNSKGLFLYKTQPPQSTLQTLVA